MNKFFKNIFLSTAFILGAMSTSANEPVVVLTTDLGTIKIKLYDDTPTHRDNFIKLAKQGFYNDLLFHRVIKDFMIQGGDPDSKNAPANKSLGAGDVGYTQPAEILYPAHYHKKGALAAARQGDQVNPEKRSSGCQFYIVQGKTYSDKELNRMEDGNKQKAIQKAFYELVAQNKDQIMELRRNHDQDSLLKMQNDFVEKATARVEAEPDSWKMTEQMKKDYKEIGGTPFLDKEYTVFGEVIEGLDVVDKIAAVSTKPGDRPVDDIKMKVSVQE